MENQRFGWSPRRTPKVCGSCWSWNTSRSEDAEVSLGEQKLVAHFVKIGKKSQKVLSQYRQNLVALFKENCSFLRFLGGFESVPVWHPEVLKYFCLIS